MAGDPYCGKCHTWMYPMQGVAQETVWLCDCPVGKEEIGKDPNCHNANHAHYDPQSPIVLSQKAEREDEETRAELDAILREANEKVED